MQEQDIVRIVSEPEFKAALMAHLDDLPYIETFDFVTGPGRSGAICAVYVSHLLGIPYVPFKHKPHVLEKALIVDTARETGATMRKAMRFYKDFNPVELVVFEEPPRVAFWYEAEKPQRYRHERKADAASNT